MKLELPPKTILLPSPVLIIGTYGSDGKPNIMNAAGEELHQANRHVLAFRLGKLHLWKRVTTDQIRE